jgi:hypothetical protein
MYSARSIALLQAMPCNCHRLAGLGAVIGIAALAATWLLFLLIQWLLLLCS